MKRPWPGFMLTALGGATICCLWIVGPLVSPSHNAIYHWSGSAAAIFIPSFLDFAFVWLIFTILLSAAQRAGRGPAAIWAGIVIFLPLTAFKSVVLLTERHPAPWISRSLFGVSAAVFVLFHLLYRPAYQAGLERMRKLVTGLFDVAAVYGLVMLVQLAWFGWQARRLNVPQSLHQAAQSPVAIKAGRPRVIWILLDELSYRQVYGHRFHGLSLPTFDQLAQQSAVFTDVIPAGIMTEVVMPSLIAGTPVNRIESSPDGNGLLLHNPLTKRWKAFNPYDTVFHDALNAGYNTAIAGWFNPYCRILPEVLDQCFWTFNSPAPNDMLPHASPLRNVLNPFVLNSIFTDYLPSAITYGVKAEDMDAKVHISDYREISDAADKLLRNPSANFILIHMALPHPDGIYNRFTHSFALRGSSYIDNLALADAYLAHVRSVLESMGQWDSSAVVVMGDHSWRTKLLWASTPEWTPEEELASNGGQFDDRPAYIVKLPEEKHGVTIDTRFEAADTRMLFNSVMSKQVSSVEDLLSWTEMLYRRHSHE